MSETIKVENPVVKVSLSIKNQSSDNLLLIDKEDPYKKTIKETFER